MKKPRANVWTRSMGLVLAVTVAAFAAGAVANQLTFFRIGTGSTGGTYFPMGSLIANAVSNPPGSRPCDKGGSCGVPGLIAVAQSTKGSVDNVDAIAAGTLESGLCQADVAYWAYHGTGVYKKKGRVEGLRAIANLYPEAVHLLVRAESGIDSVAGLKGKRISLGEKGSGTLVDAEIILRGYGLRPKQVKASYLRLDAAAELLAANQLDGLFMVAGAPARALADLAERIDIRLVPIAGPKAESLTKKYPFFAAGEIPAGVYRGVPTTRTLTVGAQWVVSEAVNADLVYALTRALWNNHTQRLLREGHPKGEQIRLITALSGIGIPLHRGAARYYSDVGMLDTVVTPQEEKPAN